LGQWNNKDEGGGFFEKRVGTGDQGGGTGGVRKKIDAGGRKIRWGGEKKREEKPGLKHIRQGRKRTQ